MSRNNVPPAFNINFMVMSMDSESLNDPNNTNIPFPFPFAPRPQQQQNAPNNASQQVPIFGGFGNPILSSLMASLGFPNINANIAPNSNTPFGMNFHDFLDHLFHQQAPRGAPPAAKDIISKLPEETITQKHIDEKAECSVCKDTFQLDDKSVQLPCMHMYHKDCIEPWLKQHCTCPVCRYELPTDDQEYEKGRKQRMANRKLAEDILTQMQHAPQSDTSPISEEDVEQLATEFVEQQPMCCMQTMTKEPCVLLRSEAFVSLKCGHSFHVECLETALRITGEEHTMYLGFRCPLCKEETQILDNIQVD